MKISQVNRVFITFFWRLHTYLPVPLKNKEFGSDPLWLAGAGRGFRPLLATV